MYRDTAWTYWQYYIDLLYHRRRSRRAAVHHFRVSLTRTFWPPKSSLKHQKQTSASAPRTVEWNIVNAAHQCFNPPFFPLFFFFFAPDLRWFPGKMFRLTPHWRTWSLTNHSHTSRSSSPGGWLTRCLHSAACNDRKVQSDVNSTCFGGGSWRQRRGGKKKKNSCSATELYCAVFLFFF